MTKDPVAQRCANLTNVVAVERGDSPFWAIENFDGIKRGDVQVAFRRYVQAVSDALEEAQYGGFPIPPILTQFVLTKPVDRLVEAFRAEFGWKPSVAKDVSAALAKHGLKIVVEGGE